MASRFWVGGTGTWDAADTTHWSATTGGAGGASVPGSGDTVTLDASSGGGTVTVNTTVNVISITMGAFTGTLDFSANDNNVTLQTFSGTGSGVRTLNMGDGTWTITGVGTVWNMLTTTNLTFNANSSVLTFAATSTSARIMAGNLTYSTVTISPNASGGPFTFNTASTIGTLNVDGQNYIMFAQGVTHTITSLDASGSSGSGILLASNLANSQATISVAAGNPTMAWCGIRDLTFAGGATFAATNSFDFGRNSGITITAPSGGGGGVIG